jgi:hypothetical protein
MALNTIIPHLPPTLKRVRVVRTACAESFNRVANARSRPALTCTCSKRDLLANICYLLEEIRATR